MASAILCFVLYRYSLKVKDKGGGIFYIPARKSTTDAVQFGGVPLALAIITSWLFFGQFGPSFMGLHKSIASILFFAIAPGMIITLYGYLDDKYELRPIIKLFAQFLAINLFAIFVSRYLLPTFSTISFLVVSFFGLAAVNGQNLLDGLDTITVKVASISLLQFVFLGLFYNIESVTTISIVCLIPLFVFYFYNREPAKIHLGEVGGAFIGFTLVVLACIFHREMIMVEHPDKRLQIFFQSLLPISLPVIELGVSFLRRLLNSKSPFQGDRFHLHHILKNYKKLTATQASNFISVFYLFVSGFCSFIAVNVNAILGAFLAYTSITLMNFYLGKDYWFSKETLDLSARSIFQFIRKKDVMIIETSIIDEFKITIVEEEPKRSGGGESNLDSELNNLSKKDKNTGS